MKVEFTIPLTKNLIVSEANRGGEHWTAKSKRHAKQKMLMRIYLFQYAEYFPFPCIVTLTRIAPRQLDDDNLSASFKYFRDAIAGYLVPGDKPDGQKDNDKRIKWQYNQMKGEKGQYALKVEIEPTNW